MQITAQQLFKELDSKSFRPFYVIVGEETFQIGEIIERLKSAVLGQSASSDFQYEAWEGEGLDGGNLRASLEELPGLFSDGGPRLVICRTFEKASAGALEVLDGYFTNPVETTVFVMVASKIDKRKAWIKHLETSAGVLEVDEPQDREWPRWHGYLEKKIGKKIEGEAWERLVATSQKRLATLWSELQKVATFVGDRNVITSADVALLAAGEAGEDIFGFAEDVVYRRAERSFRRFHNLLREGESEVKILSILVRQFRIIQQYRSLAKTGVTDPKVVGPQIGVHPFFVSKIASQSKLSTDESLTHTIQRLAEADYRLKTGHGGLFENFLVPYFG